MTSFDIAAGEFDRPTATIGTTRPRIGVDLHVLDGKYQGSRSHLLGLYGELTRMCPQFDFIFLLEKTEALSRIPGFDLHNVELVRMPPRSAWVRLGWQLPRLRRRLRLDLLHTQYVMPLQPMRGNAVTVHDVLFEPFPQFFTRLFVLRSRLLVRWSARRADLLFTVSEYSRREIAERFDMPGEDVDVLHNAVNRDVFFPGPCGAETIQARGLAPQGYLLTVGRIEPRKNHAALLRAYRELEGTPPPLVIIGQRDFAYGAFEAELARMPADRTVHVLSDVNDEELPAWYRHARLFIYPSLAEGFGMPPLEALASGTPVITSDVTACPEVVGDAGLLVDPGDPQALRDAMARVLSDAALRRQLVERGLEKAKAYSWSSAAAVMAAAYQRHFQSLGSGVVAQPA